MAKCGPSPVASSWHRRRPNSIMTDPMRWHDHLVPSRPLAPRYRLHESHNKRCTGFVFTATYRSPPTLVDVSNPRPQNPAVGNFGNLERVSRSAQPCHIIREAALIAPPQLPTGTCPRWPWGLRVRRSTCKSPSSRFSARNTLTCGSKQHVEGHTTGRIRPYTLHECKTTLASWPRTWSPTRVGSGRGRHIYAHETWGCQGGAGRGRVCGEPRPPLSISYPFRLGLMKPVCADAMAE